MHPDDGLLLALIPPGTATDFLLIMESSPGDPARFERLGYGHVASARENGFDLERDFYPYPNAHFKAIVCCDLLETLKHDPMYMLDEIHRVLRPRCHLVLTTRQFALDQIGSLLENCGLEVTHLEEHGGRVYASGRKVGPLRERHPKWLYPDRT